MLREVLIVPTRITFITLLPGLETHVAAEECYNAPALAAHPYGEMLRSEQPRLSISRRIPVGVVCVIAPFNFPIILSIRAVAPALALGNAVVLKPDPRTALCGGVVLARIFEEAGLPEGLLSVLPGGADTDEALVGHPDVRVIAFTGSTAAGRAIGELAGRHLKRAHLELGGNNADRARRRRYRQGDLGGGIRFVHTPGADLYDVQAASGPTSRSPPTMSLLSPNAQTNSPSAIRSPSRSLSVR